MLRWGDRHGRRARGTGRFLAALAALSVLAVVPVTAAAAEGQAAAGVPSASPSGQKRLSDERTETRWANPFTRAKVHTRPSGKARTIARLRLMTEDDFPEVYLVLAQWNDEKGTPWVRIRLPARPNGRTGWVVRQALGAFVTVRTQLVINRRTLRATLFKSGKKIFSARIGVGKAATPTPGGRFWIREKFRVLGAPVYGPRAIGTSAYAPTLSDWPGGGVVGLHGTNEPSLIPGRPSHGCIRLRNSDILKLYELAPTGTPIRIL